MNTTRRLYLVFGILLVLILLIALFTATFGVDEKEKYSLELIKLENGWGYQILKNKRPFIYQPFIPAVEGNRAFQDKQSAKEVGKLVIRKLENNMNPALSKEELINMDIPGIDHQ